MPGEEKKIEEKPPTAPAPVVAPPVEPKVMETPKVEAIQPTGLDGMTAAQLKAIYDKSPELFKQAGIVKDEPPKVIEPPPKSESAAPLMMDGTEIKLEPGVPFRKEEVEGYITHAKTIGLNPVQVQAEIDFQVKKYKEQLAKQPELTPKQIDEANVAKLRTEFGSKYDENMEIARAAASKHADGEMLEKLKTSDPVLIRHFLKLGKKDAEDQTRGAPNRNGNETKDEAATEEAARRKRYPNTKFSSDPAV